MIQALFAPLAYRTPELKLLNCLLCTPYSYNKSMYTTSVDQ